MKISMLSKALLLAGSLTTLSGCQLMDRREQYKALDATRDAFVEMTHVSQQTHLALPAGDKPALLQMNKYCQSAYQKFIRTYLHALSVHNLETIVFSPNNTPVITLVDCATVTSWTDAKRLLDTAVNQIFGSESHGFRATAIKHDAQQLLDRLKERQVKVSQLPGLLRNQA
jgi:hypothetical protein